MTIWKLGGLAFAAVLSSGLLIGQASAIPANGMATVAGKVGNGTQEVRWVGGWRGGLGWRGVGWRGAGWGMGWRGGWAGGRWGYGRWGYGRWGWGRGLYAYGGPGWRYGWRRPFYGAYAGWRRPLYAYAGPGWGYGRWGWRRPLLAAATVAAGVGVASAAWDSGYGYNQWGNYGYGNPYFAGGPNYAYDGPGGGGVVAAWNAGWNSGWNSGWGWRQNYGSW